MRITSKRHIRNILAENLPNEHKLVLITIISYWDVELEIDEEFIKNVSGIKNIYLVLDDLLRLGYINKLFVAKRSHTYNQYSLSSWFLNEKKQ